MHCTNFSLGLIFLCISATPSLLLQQGRDVDVPANGLPVKAAGEQVARLVLFVPRRAAHHPPVTLRKHTQRHLFIYSLGERKF